MYTTIIYKIYTDRIIFTKAFSLYLKCIFNVETWSVFLTYLKEKQLIAINNFIKSIGLKMTYFFGSPKRWLFFLLHFLYFSIKTLSGSKNLEPYNLFNISLSKYVLCGNHIELIKYLVIHTQQAYIFLPSVCNSLLRRYSTDYIKSFQLKIIFFFFWFSKTWLFSVLQVCYF